MKLIINFTCVCTIEIYFLKFPREIVPEVISGDYLNISHALRKMLKGHHCN